MAGRKRAREVNEEGARLCAEGGSEENREKILALAKEGDYDYYGPVDGDIKEVCSVLKPKFHQTLSLLDADVNFQSCQRQMDDLGDVVSSYNNAELTETFDQFRSWVNDRRIELDDLKTNYKQNKMNELNSTIAKSCPALRKGIEDKITRKKFKSFYDVPDEDKETRSGEYYPTPYTRAEQRQIMNSAQQCVVF